MYESSSCSTSLLIFSLVSLSTLNHPEFCRNIWLTGSYVFWREVFTIATTSWCHDKDLCIYIEICTHRYSAHTPINLGIRSNGGKKKTKKMGKKKRKKTSKRAMNWRVWNPRCFQVLQLLLVKFPMGMSNYQLSRLWNNNNKKGSNIKCLFLAQEVKKFLSVKEKKKN